MAESPSVRLIAFCSRELQKAGEFASRFGAQSAYDNVEVTLADPRVSAVYLAVPNAMHAELAIQCLRAGKHVLLDKPMALSASQSEAIVEAANQSGRILGLLHQQRFHPANQRLFAKIRDGSMGRIHLVRAQMGFWYALGDNWRLSRERSGGGAAMDLAPHALDILLQVAGPVRTVNARCFNLHIASDVEDFCTARLEFESGAVGQVDFSYCSHHYGGHLEVYGSEGTIIADGSLQQGERYRIWSRHRSEDMPVEEGVTPSCFKLIVEDFANAVESGRTPTVSMHDGVRVMRVIDAIYESARQDRTVSVG